VAAIALRGVTKAFATGHVAVDDVTLDVADGELLVLVGPSGCGKSTVLRLVAGLESPTHGQILIDGADATGVPAQRRDLAMVFQNYALYPHLTVRQNLSFGLEMRKLEPSVTAERVTRIAATLGLDALLERRPAQLSGGQRQRVALGRALVREPRAFLLDEPLSNLDPSLRVGTRAELALLHRRLRATMIYVTHDQEEAMTLGTRIAVMHRGRLEQVAAPLDVFERPATVFVAGFVGSPAMNLWPGRRAGNEVRTAAFAVAAPPATMGDGAIAVGVRPHDLEITPDRGGDVAGTVAVAEPLGPHAILHVQLDAYPDALARVLAPIDGVPAAGDRIGLRIRRDRVHLFDAASGRRLA
jgi:multiple sugar transport system ATP-binding protein